MKPAPTPAEAIFVIERELLSAGARCTGLRFFPFPDPDAPLVIVCAELEDAGDIQVLTRLDWPIVVTGDDYDEAAIARAFAMPSQSVH
jgi:hypothetical protein